MHTKKIYMKPHYIAMIVFITYSSFAYGFEYVITGVVSETYDDNIMQSSTVREQDFITSVMLGLGVHHEGRNQTIDFMGNFRQSFYLQYQGLNESSENCNLTYINELSGSDRFQLNDIFTHYPEPQTFGYTLGGVPGRYAYVNNALTITYVKNFSGRLAVTPQYLYQINNYLNGELFDTTIHRPGVRADYSLTEAHIFSLLYDYTLIKFDTGTRTTAHSPGGMYHIYFTRVLHFSIRGGYDFNTIDDGSEFNEPYYEASLMRDFRDGSSFRFTYSKRTLITMQNYDVLDSWRYEAELRKQIAGRVNAAFIVFYGRGRYLVQNWAQKLLGTDAELGYEFRENIIGRMRYVYNRIEYQRVEGNEQFDRNRISLELSARF